MSNNTIALLMPNLQGGGAERVAVNLANEFVIRGYSVDVVLLSASGNFLSELLPDVRIIDLNVKRFRYVLFPLVRYLNRHKPVALLANMWPLTSIASLARYFIKDPIRLVVVEHTTWSRSELVENRLTCWKIQASMHYFLPKADAIVSVSKGAADDLAQFSYIDQSLIHVIYNPIVGNSISVSEDIEHVPSKWWNGTHCKLLAVGTLKTIKDYSTMLAAFHRLCQSVDAKLLILGDGPCRADLELQATHLGIKNKLFLLGFVNDPSPYYERADLHLLSSIAEGFGNVIVEALAAGTPVVSTDCPSGPREILCDGQFGKLVPVGDVDAMAQAIVAALTESHDHEALKARAQDFSIVKATDQYEALLLGSNI